MKLNKAGAVKYIAVETAPPRDRNLTYFVATVPTSEDFETPETWLRWCRWFSYQCKIVLPEEDNANRHVQIRRMITGGLYRQYEQYKERVLEQGYQVPVHIMREMLSEVKLQIARQTTFEDRRDLTMRVGSLPVKVRAQDVVSETRKAIAYITVPDVPEEDLKEYNPYG